MLLLGVIHYLNRTECESVTTSAHILKSTPFVGNRCGMFLRFDSGRYPSNGDIDNTQLMLLHSMYIYKPERAGERERERGWHRRTINTTLELGKFLEQEANSDTV